MDTQQPYLDSPTMPHARTLSLHITTKPLPAWPLDTQIPQPQEPQPYQDDEPYHHDAPTPTSAQPQHAPSQQQQQQQHQAYAHPQSYSDTTPLHTPSIITPLHTPSIVDDENIPLAHFLLPAYPLEAPPSYSFATSAYPHPQPQPPHPLLTTFPCPSHIAPFPQPQPIDAFTSYPSVLSPSDPRHQSYVRFLRGPIALEGDEEEGSMDPDDVRHSLERLVAMFIVAAMLLTLSGLMGWLAFGAGIVG